ncbi:MAG: integrase family protein [Pseudomonadota bacterium]
MTKSFKFTVSALRSLSCSAGKTREFFQDRSQSELLLQVTRTGTKTYYVRGYNRLKEYTQKIPIGKFELVELSDAKKRAKEIAAQLALGIDPNAEREAIRQDIKFAEAFESFIVDPAKRRKKGPRRTRTTEGYRWQYERYLARRISSRKLSTLHRTELDHLHTEIGKDSGIYSANRTLALISAVLNDAISKGWQGQNSAQGIERFPEQRRERFLREDEIGPFIKACEQERNGGSRSTAEAALLALFTGLRRDNICAASWHDFDFKRGIWRISGSKMKNGELQVAYLSSYIREIIHQRYRDRLSDEWVFPSSGKNGHLVDPKKGIKRIAKLSQIDPQGVHLHCMKHTFLTYADDVSLPSAVRKRLAAHKSTSDITERYTHAREGRVREAYEKVARHMLGFAGRS